MFKGSPVKIKAKCLYFVSTERNFKINFDLQVFQVSGLNTLSQFNSSLVRGDNFLVIPRGNGDTFAIPIKRDTGPQPYNARVSPCAAHSASAAPRYVSFRRPEVARYRRVPHRRAPLEASVQQSPIPVEDRVT